MKNRPIYLSLTGGLGNQLFQLSAALSLANGREVVIFDCFGKPRKGRFGNSEISDLILPTKIDIVDRKEAHWFLQKIVGYSLRIGVIPSRFEKLFSFQKIVPLLSSLALSIYLRKVVRIFIATGNGYDSRLLQTRSNFLIGYFQSFLWTSNPDVKKIMQGLFKFPMSAEYSKYEVLAAKERPLVVHIRLQDYLVEEEFGIPPIQYYRDAIKLQMETGKYGSIWLFSDNLNSARDHFPNEFQHHIREVELAEKSSCITLGVMALGHGYVIANSTFSWWGAFLSEISDKKVIAPFPWFKGKESPELLLSEEWKTLNPWIYQPPNNL